MQCFTSNHMSVQAGALVVVDNSIMAPVFKGMSGIMQWLSYVSVGGRAGGGRQQHHGARGLRGCGYKAMVQ